MSLTALVLITVSAFLHAFWNFFSKRNAATASFFVVATSASFLCFSPFLLTQGAPLAKQPLSFWYLVIATGFFEAIYFIGLTQAYRLGDMSLAYPLVRALPILLVALVSVLLGRGEALSTLAFTGMGFMTLGCLLLPLQRLQQWSLKFYFNRVTAWVLLSVTGVTGYTLVDDAALRLLRQSIDVASSTLVYLPLQSLTTILFLLVYVIFVEGWQVKPFSMVPKAVFTGIVITVTYGIALAALAFVKDVSYANAFRQLSIPLGALLGMWLAKEPAYLPKLLGIALMLVGLVLIVLG
jgi:drug/metabolite transporter (DMT)-like permease